MSEEDLTHRGVEEHGITSEIIVQLEMNKVSQRRTLHLLHLVCVSRSQFQRMIHEKVQCTWVLVEENLF